MQWKEIGKITPGSKDLVEECRHFFLSFSVSISPPLFPPYSLALSLHLSSLSLSLPPSQPLPSSPPLEAQLTSVATERCASRRASLPFCGRFDIPIALHPRIWLTLFFFFIPPPPLLQTLNYVRIIFISTNYFPGQGFLWHLKTEHSQQASPLHHLHHLHLLLNQRPLLGDLSFFFFLILKPDSDSW